MLINEQRKAYQKQWQKDNVERVRFLHNRWLNDNPGKFRQYRKGKVVEYRKWKEFAGPCEKCGNSDGRVLEFHHLNPVEKRSPLTVNHWFSLPLNLLIEEIAKCQVLCRNCHTIEEFENGVWRCNKI